LQDEHWFHSEWIATCPTIKQPTRRFPEEQKHSFTESRGYNGSLYTKTGLFNNGCFEQPDLGENKCGYVYLQTRFKFNLFIQKSFHTRLLMFNNQW